MHNKVNTLGAAFIFLRQGIYHGVRRSSVCPRKNRLEVPEKNKAVKRDNSNAENMQLLKKQHAERKGLA